ncbi:MAG: hypothetical protein FVQ83_15390 [Chloroflexi bacterium]|nr:hypothetical protein [Chloroflexota bacterium]
MSETITREIFDHMVELAALELDEAEAEYLRTELNKQLQAIEVLKAVKLDKDTPIASHGVPYTPEISAQPRKDIIDPFPNPEEIVALSPETEDGYLIVPDIPHEDVE